MISVIDILIGSLSLYIKLIDLVLKLWLRLAARNAAPKENDSSEFSLLFREILYCLKKSVSDFIIEGNRFAWPNNSTVDISEKDNPAFDSAS